MNLDEYINKDVNFWDLKDGDCLNLLDEAIERMKEAHSKLSSVLCDPDGNVVCHGSDSDRSVVSDALKLLVPSSWRSLATFSVDGYFVDDPDNTFEGYIFKESHEIGDDDEDVFYYGLSEQNIVNSLNKKTGEDFVITAYKKV